MLHPRPATPVPPSHVPASVPDSSVAVRLTDVSKSFGDIRALAGLSLGIGTGSTVALLGPNGAGKSTAISIMLGLLRPDSGTALVMGMAPRGAVSSGMVGVMLQASALPLGATVRELVRFARDLYPAPMAMDAIVDHAGLGAYLDRSVDGLSGGEAQRARFAIAIAGDPQLIFLDEPTSGMDVESRRSFWDTMRVLAAAGRTILFATHYLEEADQAADQVIVIGAGRILASGSPSELKAMVGGRVIRCRFPGADLEAVRRLPAVTRVEAQARRADHPQH